MTVAIMVFVVLASIYYHFFPLTAIMLLALALLDDVPITTIAFNNASVPPQPVKWELDRVSVISSVLGLLGVIQSFGLLYQLRATASGFAVGIAKIGATLGVFVLPILKESSAFQQSSE
jgi:hypothetical protein